MEKLNVNKEAGFEDYDYDDWVDENERFWYNGGRGL